MPGTLPVIPNQIQELHPTAQRVPLGTKNPVECETVQPDQSGHYWFYIPTKLAGDIRIEIDDELGPELVLYDEVKEILQTKDALKITFPVPADSHGFYFMSIKPATGVIVKFLVDGWPKEKDGTPLIPWNFFQFPYHENQYRTAKFDSTATQRSAMKKYDQAFGLPSFDSASAWEEKHHISPTAEGWEGHCAMGAVASIVFKQPEAGAANGVTFTRDELELLAAEWTASNIPDLKLDWKIGAAARGRLNGMPVIQFIKPTDPLWKGDNFEPEFNEIRRKFVVDRYMDAFGPDDPAEYRALRVELDEEAKQLDFVMIRQDFGQAASHLLDFLLLEVKGRGEAIYGDFGPSDPKSTAEVISCSALFYFNVEFFELARFANQDPRTCEVVITILTNRDGAPDITDPMPAVIINNIPYKKKGGHWQTYQYILDVRYSDRGDIEAIIWREALSASGRVAAPHLLRVVGNPVPVKGPGNPRIGAALLTSKLVVPRDKYKSRSR